jgi:hypothetical protein
MYALLSMVDSLKCWKAKIVVFIFQLCSWTPVSPPSPQYHCIRLILVSLVYLGSTLFTCKTINPLATTIRLPPACPASLSIANSEPLSHTVLDADLCASLPAYEHVGSYLGELLVLEINSQCARDIFCHYDHADKIVQEFQFQLMSYVRRCSPFDRYLGSGTALAYWDKISRHPDTQILAYLATKLL